MSHEASQDEEKRQIKKAEGESESPFALRSILAT
jgi:hypothetical protein